MGYKLRVPCLLLALCGLWPLAARAAAPLLLVRNHTMAPFRFVAETLDATAWVTPGGVMAMRVGDTTLIFMAGKSSAVVNGVTVPLDVAPFVRANTTYVPLRFCLETFGSDVNWENGQPQVSAVVTRHPLTRPPLELTEVVYPLPGTLLYKRAPAVVLPATPVNPSAPLPTVGTPTPPAAQERSSAAKAMGDSMIDMMTPMMKALGNAMTHPKNGKAAAPTKSKPAAKTAKPAKQHAATA